MKKYYSLSILCFFSFCGAPAVKKVAPNLPLPTTIDAAVQSDFRTPKNRARDIYRHPAETLKFFGLKKNMTVVEIWPSAGWYSEIIAPYLKESGHYYAALPVDGAYSQKLLTWLEDHPQVRGSVTLTKFTPPNHTAIATEESVDMVLTFRNVHNWMKSNAEKEAFAAFFRILKPGGVLGVVEHRANPKQKKDPKASKGYVHESDVIAMAKAAGFKLIAKSEINANKKDTKDYPEGVWTLPPSYRLGDKDKTKYAAIGESDRMTLKFQKP